MKIISLFLFVLIFTCSVAQVNHEKSPINDQIFLKSYRDLSGPHSVDPYNGIRYLWPKYSQGYFDNETREARDARQEADLLNPETMHRLAYQHVIYIRACLHGRGIEQSPRNVYLAWRLGIGGFTKGQHNATPQCLKDADLFERIYARNLNRLLNSQFK